ncbi:MAG TPA: aldose 1-epimerase [Gemmataceae bacterium]|nr:aldose 1-epimerase [Gemmataceae bacterium]
MTFRVTTRQQSTSANLDGTIYVLDSSTGDRAEVWPALGFNCYQWKTNRSGQVLDLLYADPQLFDNGRPTRSGIPILFPFPNRIREGRFPWSGRTFQLPLNDSTKKNAAHGFVCRSPWRVVDQGADASSAWLTGEFQASKDNPDERPLWPADYVLRVTYRLLAGRLRVEADVTNPDRGPLPFGLGYHPYFKVPFAPGGTADDCLIQVPAKSFWVLEESLPTGEQRPVDAARDFTRPRPFGGVSVDDVLTDLQAGGPAPPAGLRWNGTLRQGQHELRVFSSPDFRELVVFTPPHRQAFCLEPYTCPTDAINLQSRGLDVGWKALPPGGRWSSVVELAV